MAECLAAREGILLALTTSLYPLQLETDSLHVFRLLHADMEDEYEVGALISQLKQSLQSRVSHISYSFVNWEGNLAAHTLVQMALTCDQLVVWMMDLLNCLVSYFSFLILVFFGLY